ncbi:hypothetical protein JCM14108_3197 [Lentilactobacillus farraginis DSM 18382 = JCM 14108]|uniref:Uncharacterized protein n=2 Tax=Lentilactobacillus farraginis TaxID=390841 RepID=X0PC89_9LACO|nr:hypothetical protein JCM14108_3197 [Lentilactobacillus farraginis DSM 18382 = JCM 14108]
MYETPGLGLSKWISIFSWLIVILSISYVGVRFLLVRKSQPNNANNKQSPTNRKPLD